MSQRSISSTDRPWIDRHNTHITFMLLFPITCNHYSNSLKKVFFLQREIFTIDLNLVALWRSREALLTHTAGAWAFPHCLSSKKDGVVLRPPVIGKNFPSEGRRSFPDVKLIILLERKGFDEIKDRECPQDKWDGKSWQAHFSLCFLGVEHLIYQKRTSGSLVKISQAEGSICAIAELFQLVLKIRSKYLFTTENN